ncbi:MAG: ACP S-malonyltransferase, partial [Candidatus Omnitrophica bacterium]|nr:ACP S-malonyltransferase [Candidatus Omnitrophota bacterium]
CPGQIVISGSKEGIEAAEKEAKDLGVRRAVALEVSGAFHSSFMRGSSLKLEQELSRVRINEPRIPVISNVTAQEAVSIEQIKDNLVQQVARSVLWEDSMKFIISCGVNIFIEFGPGKVLKGLMRRINEKVEVKNIEKKEDVAEVKYEA